MKVQIPAPPEAEVRPDSAESQSLPVGDTQPEPLPQWRYLLTKKEMSPLALVVALLALAMLLAVPALILLDRLQP